MRRTHLPPVLAALSLAACVPQPVEWEIPRQSPPAASPLVASLDAVAGAPVVADAELPDVLPAGGCPGSARLAVAAGEERYLAWWEPRPDSSALLLVARSGDAGRSWAQRYVVDSLDRGVRGCRRPAPSIAADSANGYVHVAYALDAPEGPGLFYAHLMDPRAQFEPPAAVVYGERPGATAVASDDQSVVVAYENPNGARPQVAVAVSRTAGHTFEGKTIPASVPEVPATTPSVAVRGTRLVVAWVQPNGPVVRTGRIK
jgi:hypothetical protein